MPDRIQMRDKSLNELEMLVKEEAKKSALGVVLPFHYEYPDDKVIALVPVAIEALIAIHNAVKISAFKEYIVVAPVKPEIVKKTSLTLYQNIHDVSFYVYDNEKQLWINARSHPWILSLLKKTGIITVTPKFEAEIKDSWGGYGASCGGAYYVFKIMKNNDVIAEGQASYNACIPGYEGANFAYTEIVRVTEPILVSSIDGAILLQP